MSLCNFIKPKRGIEVICYSLFHFVQGRFLPVDFEKLYIGGQWTAGASGQFIEVENPATRQIFARVPAGNEEDVDKAARAAHEALPAWAALPLTERIDLMEKFLAIFKSQENELIAVKIKELGSHNSIKQSSQVEYGKNEFF